MPIVELTVYLRIDRSKAELQLTNEYRSGNNTRSLSDTYLCHLQSRSSTKSLVVLGISLENAAFEELKVSKS